MGTNRRTTTRNRAWRALPGLLGACLLLVGCGEEFPQNNPLGFLAPLQKWDPNYSGPDEGILRFRIEVRGGQGGFVDVIANGNLLLQVPVTTDPFVHTFSDVPGGVTWYRLDVYEALLDHVPHGREFARLIANDTINTVTEIWNLIDFARKNGLAFSTVTTTLPTLVFEDAYDRILNASKRYPGFCRGAITSPRSTPGRGEDDRRAPQSRDRAQRKPRSSKADRGRSSTRLASSSSDLASASPGPVSSSGGGRSWKRIPFSRRSSVALARGVATRPLPRPVSSWAGSICSKAIPAGPSIRSRPERRRPKPCGIPSSTPGFSRDWRWRISPRGSSRRPAGGADRARSSTTRSAAGAAGRRPSTSAVGS
jgi:hypothetical protein